MTNNENESKSGLNRRQFMTAGAGMVMALAVSKPAIADVTVCQKNTEALPFQDPVLCQASSNCDFTLTEKSVEVNIVGPNCDNTAIITTRTYNGSVPGPTFKLKPGDELNISLINELGDNPIDQNCEALGIANQPHCFNTSNLHFHGLHVSPQSKYIDDDPEKGIEFSSDDVLIKLDGKEGEGKKNKNQYKVRLPDFHAPGTHWYHPHMHGSTAIQLANGLAGAIIVEEPDNQKIEVNEDHVWLIQEISPEKMPDGTTVNSANDIYNGGRSKLLGFTVNGQNQPTLTMYAGHLHRWRFINATGTPRGFMNVALTKDSAGENVISGLNLMAVDGIMFYGKKPQLVKDEYFISPGNRADFLVQIADPGIYYIWKKPAKIRGNANGPTSSQLLATINVVSPPSGVEAAKTLPTKLPSTNFRPKYLTPIKDGELTKHNSIPDATITIKDPLDSSKPKQIDVKEVFVFQASPRNNFIINGQKFGNSENNTPTITVPLGNVEEWNLANIPIGIDNKVADHPFHIHVNPFQVVGEKIDPNEPNDPDNWVWRDTVAIPANTSIEKPLKIRSRFVNYPGNFVLHCHILIHEDQGMMYAVNITDKDNQGVGPGVPCNTEPCKAPST